MAYSVVGYDFYMKHRNLDGSDVLLEDKVDQPEKYKQVPQNPGFNDDDAYDDNPPFSQEQISWFGMSRILIVNSAIYIIH